MRGVSGSGAGTPCCGVLPQSGVCGLCSELLGAFPPFFPFFSALRCEVFKVLWCFRHVELPGRGSTKTATPLCLRTGRAETLRSYHTTEPPPKPPGIRDPPQNLRELRYHPLNPRELPPPPKKQQTKNNRTSRSPSQSPQGIETLPKKKPQGNGDPPKPPGT